jgi:hypothetical protein
VFSVQLFSFQVSDYRGLHFIISNSEFIGMSNTQNTFTSFPSDYRIELLLLPIYSNSDSNFVIGKLELDRRARS